MSRKVQQEEVRNQILEEVIKNIIARHIKGGITKKELDEILGHTDFGNPKSLVLYQEAQREYDEQERAKLPGKPPISNTVIADKIKKEEIEHEIEDINDALNDIKAVVEKYEVIPDIPLIEAELVKKENKIRRNKAAIGHNKKLAERANARLKARLTLVNQAHEKKNKMYEEDIRKLEVEKEEARIKERLKIAAEKEKEKLERKLERKIEQKENLAIKSERKRKGNIEIQNRDDLIRTIPKLIKAAKRR